MTPFAPGQIVKGYLSGAPFDLLVAEVECGHLMRADLAHQVQEAFAAARADHIFVSISSAWRSMEKQTELYEGFKEGKPGFNAADQPGWSKHQAGMALDLAFGSGEERIRFCAIAGAYGFSRPHLSEPWHFLVHLQTPTKLPPEPTT